MRNNTGWKEADNLYILIHVLMSFFYYMLVKVEEKAHGDVVCVRQTQLREGRED